MHQADYTFIAVLRKKYEELRQNPEIVEALFSQYYHYEPVREILGPDWVKNAVNVICGTGKAAKTKSPRNEELQIIPALAESQNTNTMLTVSYASSEDQLYFNSFGSNQTVYKQPLTYISNFTALGYSKTSGQQNFDILEIPYSDEFSKVIFIGQELKGPNYCGKVLEVLTTKAKISLSVDKPLPLDSSGKKILKGWSLTSSSAFSGRTFQTSLDGLSVQLLLHTVGLRERHMIYQTVVRYLLKSSREDLSLLNFNVQGISQSPIVQDNISNDPSFQTVYSVQAQTTDYWIQNKWEPIDKFCLTVIACSEDPVKQEVVVQGDHANVEEE